MARRRGARNAKRCLAAKEHWDTVARKSPRSRADYAANNTIEVASNGRGACRLSVAESAPEALCIEAEKASFGAFATIRSPGTQTARGPGLRGAGMDGGW